jgi:HK97 family phage prohead protease
MQTMNATKNFSVTSKDSSTNSRIIRFVGSDESVDRDGDTIAVEGWDLAAYTKNPVVLYGHDQRDLPIGRSVVTIDRRAKQLLFDVKFPTIAELSSDPDHPSEHALKVDAIYNLAKAGILNTVSVGFRGIDYETTSTGYAFKKQELMEVSLVPVPANPNAIAILRAASFGDAIIKGVTTMTENLIEKGNRRLSMESKTMLDMLHSDMMKACTTLRTFIDMGEQDMYMGDGMGDMPADDKTGNPVVGQEIGSNVNEQQPAKDFIEIVEKNS